MILEKDSTQQIVPAENPQGRPDTAATESLMPAAADAADPKAAAVAELPMEASVPQGITIQQFLDVVMPTNLPPIFKDYAGLAPDGFKAAAVLSLLPILGTLGSRLRATYINGRQLSPTFLVVLVGEQGSGKSFIDDAAKYFLKPVQDADDHGDEQVRCYESLMRKISRANVKVSAKSVDAEVPDDPRPVIRIIEPKVTEPALYKVMANNKDLHAITVASEIGQVIRSLGSTHGNISYLLCQAFDNSRCGQRTAGDTSFTGHVNMYYNVLYSGTPNVVSKFFTDETQENGMMSRFIIISLPYNPYAMPEVWGHFAPKQELAVQALIHRLNDVSVCKRLIVGPDGSEEVVYDAMGEHEMKMPWLNACLKEWERTLLQLAAAERSRVHAMFHKRAMVTGFRAGMLAYYLFGERPTKQIKEAVCQFAVWVASCMLNGLVENYTVESHASGIAYPTAFNMLPNRFTWDQVTAVLAEARMKTPTRNVINRWKNENEAIRCICETGVKEYVKINSDEDKQPAVTL